MKIEDIEATFVPRIYCNKCGKVIMWIDSGGIETYGEAWHGDCDKPEIGHHYLEGFKFSVNGGTFSYHFDTEMFMPNMSLENVFFNFDLPMKK